MRDDFALRTIDALAKRVGYRCSNPSCRRKTIGPGSDETSAASIGTAAHITAASGLGPRYDSSIRPSERSHISNGIWLCADCGRMIDSDPNRFSVELLRRWKKIAENEALAELKGDARWPNLIGDPFLSFDLNPATNPNPQAFYQGAPASYADIAANLDIERTQYVRPWKDDQQQIRRPWKEQILRQKSTSNAKPRIMFLCGCRGTGRTTLLRRIAYDLRSAKVPCVDLLLSGLTPAHVDPLRQLAGLENGVPHIITTIDDIHSRMDVAPFLDALSLIVASTIAAVVFVRVDSSDIGRVESVVGPVLQRLDCRSDTLRLRSQLDDIEMAELLDRLTTYKCLFFLQGKPRDYQLKVFARKAKRSLIAMLLEATRAPEGGEFSTIVWREFESLNPITQALYAFVALCHSRGLPVPGTVLDGLQDHIPGLRTPKQRSEPIEMRDILSVSASGEYTTRNRRLAEVFAQQFTKGEYDRTKLALFIGLFRGIDVRRPDHKLFFKRLLRTSIFGCLHALEPLVTEIRHTVRSLLGPTNAARTLNSLIRTLQSRREYQRAFVLARESIQLWRDGHNQAYFLRGFCEYYLGRHGAAQATALRLIEHIELPYHFLHGVGLLRLLRDWKKCSSALEHFAVRYSGELDRFPDFARFKLDADLWTKLELTSIATSHSKPRIELDRIEIVLIDGGATDDVIFAAYQALIRRQPTFVGAFTSMFTWLNSPVSDSDETRPRRYEWLRDECTYHLDQISRRKKYPAEIVSLLHSNLGRALFRLDYINSAGQPSSTECEQHFRRAISLRPNNWYAHNWFGTYAKEVKKDRLESKLAYESALAGDWKNPVFRYNLGRLYFETAQYDETALAKAWELAVQSKDICLQSERWNSFARYPDELAWTCATLRQRSTLIHGDPLDPSDVIQGDVE